jgi:uncharacterized protein YtpQ (UPF0354 family)
MNLVVLFLGIVTSSPEAYTASAAPTLQAELKARGVDARVEVGGPLSLKVRHLAVSLERVWAQCKTDQEGCAGGTAQYLAGVAGMLKTSLAGEPTPTVAQLRIVARDTAYVAEVRRSMPTAIVRPIAGTLDAMLMIDFPTAARPAMAEDLRQLKLDEKAAWAAALANLERLPEIGKLPAAAPSEGLGLVEPAGYYNSGLLLSPRWAEIAKRAKGRLLATVPSQSLVIIADTAQPTAATALLAMSAEMRARADRPVSAQILMWTDRGWAPFSP